MLMMADVIAGAALSPATCPMRRSQ